VAVFDEIVGPAARVFDDVDARPVYLIRLFSGGEAQGIGFTNFTLHFVVLDSATSLAVPEAVSVHGMDT
jgi:hypothetical protein